jgi:hypothetical protein
MFNSPMIFLFLVIIIVPNLTVNSQNISVKAVPFSLHESQKGAGFGLEFNGEWKSKLTLNLFFLFDTRKDQSRFELETYKTVRVIPGLRKNFSMLNSGKLSNFIGLFFEINNTSVGYEGPSGKGASSGFGMAAGLDVGILKFTLNRASLEIVYNLGYSNVNFEKIQINPILGNSTVYKKIDLDKGIFNRGLFSFGYTF